MDSIETRIDIGISREDQDRIAELRDANPKKSAAVFSLETVRTLNEYVKRMARIKLQEKVTFFQLLSVMINAGVPLIAAMRVLAAQTKNLKLQDIITDLGNRMEEGKKLSVAMESYRNLFSQAEIGMVASGEISGNLNEILKDMAEQAEKSASIVGKVKGALIYPISIIFVMIICVTLLLVLVIPKLTELFSSGGAELPLSTQILIAVSGLALKWWPLLILFAALLPVFWKLLSKNKSAKYFIDSMFLRVPVFGQLIRNLLLSRFTRLLASLIRAGIPIVKALEISASALGNRVYGRRISFAAQDVAQGIPLGEALLGDENLFPPMVPSMILVGEKTANMSEVSDKIADFYEERVNLMVNSLSKLMEPIILIGMGLLVAFIVSAIMQPIIGLSDITGAL